MTFIPFFSHLAHRFPFCVCARIAAPFLSPHLCFPEHRRSNSTVPSTKSAIADQNVFENIKYKWQKSTAV